MEWMHRYGIGFGLMGEQGIEAIHSKFNTCYRTYASMQDKVQRLHSVIQEHFLSVSLMLEAKKSHRQSDEKSNFYTHPFILLQ